MIVLGISSWLPSLQANTLRDKYHAKTVSAFDEVDEETEALAEEVFDTPLGTVRATSVARACPPSDRDQHRAHTAMIMRALAIAQHSIPQNAAYQYLGQHRRMFLSDVHTLNGICFFCLAYLSLTPAPHVHTHSNTSRLFMST